MKKFTIFLISILFTLNLTAQTVQKQDTVLKVNGDELVGNVKAIGDSDIKFIYSGETLVYSIKKSDILKITYTSGRVEQFNEKMLSSEKKDEAAAQPEQQNSTVDHRNRVAILPFDFISDNQSAGDEMGYKVQVECYTNLSKHAGELTILDPRTTNALLIKAGASQDKIRGFTMDELCNILGVEYIIDGTVTQNKGTQNSYKNQNYNMSSGTDSKSAKDNGKITGSSTSSTTQDFETSISMNIYTDTNKNIFSEGRKSLWSTPGAYKNSLQYLLKRTPLYRK